MQSVANETPEGQELRPGMDAAEISAHLEAMLQSVPHAVGVNNHEGSRATADSALMNALMPLLRSHQLFFVDSRTTAATVAFETARQTGTRTAFRNVPFLDDVQDEVEIRKQLELAIHAAKEKSEAIAIGHPHPTTLHALSEVLPQVESQGVHLVFVSRLMH